MVQATVNGTVIAESTNTVFVEGNHYFPLEDIKSDVLSQSQTTYVCPLKGDASYFNATVDGRKIDDIAWVYPNPTSKVQIKGHVAFDKSKVRIA
ncbi:DUF427-domain-containing protein [Artomyces pyxidatus]|uniref:DUF427-domain-containing protein n=1 Tax=Artomyces pyxidatus TaxID=48021 RepID=A0ACB8SNS4_9AGAM|nr:DUF427-domain-containing protein [Artomyces pyxidatus]